jgi:hypothetical protein
MYRTVLIEHFPRKRLRLVCSDGYLFLRAWVDFDPDDATGETAPAKGAGRNAARRRQRPPRAWAPEARTQAAEEEVAQVEEENPDTNPTLQLETRAPDRDQGQLEGIAVPLFFIDFPEHETVALSTLDSGFPDWRKLIPNVSECTDVETVMLGTEQLGRIAKVGKLYAKSPARWHSTALTRPSALRSDRSSACSRQLPQPPGMNRSTSTMIRSASIISKSTTAAMSDHDRTGVPELGAIEREREPGLTTFPFPSRKGWSRFVRSRLS